MHVRSYGSSGPIVIVLHGGPGAAGSAAGLARGLADCGRVLEPYQRGSGGEGRPLTVARHVADLHELIESRSAGDQPILVGHSWGAMLALAYAAEFPGRSAGLALVGCGTFDPEARAQFKAALAARAGGDFTALIEKATADIADPDQRLAAVGERIERLCAYDLIEGDDEPDARCDAQANEEAWADMLRCQAAGIYPAAFAAIREPVLMLHGAADPHPGRLIRDGLAAVMPQLEYVEWERCGHSPWRERAVREEFFRVLREWVGKK